MNNIQWQLVLDKVGTILIDRRFWVAVLTIIAVVFGLPEYDTDKLSDEALDWVTVVGRLVALIVVPMGLTVSWTKRPPSGTRFKEQSEVTEVADKLLALIEAAKNS